MNQTWKPKPGDVTAKKKSCSTRFHTTSRLFTPPLTKKGKSPGVTRRASPPQTRSKGLGFPFLSCSSAAGTLKRQY